MTLLNNILQLLSYNNIWTQGTHPIIIGYSCKVHRNLASYFFPNRLDHQTRKEILHLIFDTVKSIDAFKSPQLFLAERLAPYEREFLFEHFLATKAIQDIEIGEGFILDQTGSILLSLNIEDHLQMQVISAESSIDIPWRKLIELDAALQSQLPIAFTTQFGYLTSNVKCSGTGLFISAYLHLPLLIYQDQLQKELKYLEPSISYIGLQGSIDNLIGNMLILQNKNSIYTSEEKIIASLEQATTQLLVAEKQARQHMMNTADDPHLKDKIARAFGLLVHSYELETIETLNALSMCQLAVDFGWLGGVSTEIIKDTFFLCRRAHLANVQHNLQLSEEQLKQKRAELVKSKFSGAHLKF